MKKINFHTHTNRCRHADGIAADYVQSALSAGVTQLGFSDHAPFPDYDFGMRMPYCELSEYIEDINALTVQYRTDIILWKGLEIEYLPEYRDYYEALLTRSGWIICLWENISIKMHLEKPRIIPMHFLQTNFLSTHKMLLTE